MKPTKLFSVAALAGLLLLLAGLVQASAQQPAPPFAHPAFQQVWNRTDSLVAAGTVARTWFWGPQPNTPGLLEPFEDAPGGTGARLVQYFDKSRMELNDPNADPTSPFYVTNGLLTVELIGGCIQTSSGQPCGQPRYPADIPMSGDPGDQLAPTYAGFQAVSNTAAGDHPAENRTGQSVTATIDRRGQVGNDPSKVTVPLTRIAYYEQITRHNIPEAFWNFLNQSGPVREGGRTATGPLISPWFYASGLPISEAYWARATIGGQVRDVLIQAYERRVLTYVPTNEPAWQVEMGNIGQHYFNWRYGFQGQPGAGTGTPFSTPVGGGTPTFAPTQPVATITATVAVTGTTTPAGTESPEPTATDVPATVTIIVPPGTIIVPGTGTPATATATATAALTATAVTTPIASPTITPSGTMTSTLR